MRVERLEADVYLVRGDAYDSNATIYLAGREALVVEALGSAADAEALRAFVVDELDRRVRVMIASHYFSDHLAALGKFPGAWVVAHRLYRHTWDSELYRSDEERGFFVEPSWLVGDGATIRFGRFRLELFENPGHTASTLGIEVPEIDLLHVGDTAVGRLAYFAYTSPPLLSEALDRLRRRGRGRLLASHGGVCGAAVLDSARSYLARIGEQVARLGDETSLEAAAEAIPLSSCLPGGAAGTAFEEIFHRRNLADALARGLFRGPGAGIAAGD